MAAKVQNRITSSFISTKLPRTSAMHEQPRAEQARTIPVPSFCTFMWPNGDFELNWRASSCRKILIGGRLFRFLALFSVASFHIRRPSCIRRRAFLATVKRVRRDNGRAILKECVIVYRTGRWIMVMRNAQCASMAEKWPVQEAAVFPYEEETENTEVGSIHGRWRGRFEGVGGIRPRRINIHVKFSFSRWA